MNSSNIICIIVLYSHFRLLIKILGCNADLQQINTPKTIYFSYICCHLRKLFWSSNMAVNSKLIQKTSSELCLTSKMCTKVLYPNFELVLTCSTLHLSFHCWRARAEMFGKQLHRKHGTFVHLLHFNEHFLELVCL